MKKLHTPHTLELILFVLTLLLINGCTNTITQTLGTVTIDVAAQEAASQAGIIQTPISITKAPTDTQTPTFTPTLEPPNPYTFNTETGQIDLSYGPITIKFNEGALAGKEMSATLVSPRNLGGYESASQALTVGNGVAEIRPENYGNLVLSMHSAYFHNKPLQAEIFRKYLEYWGLSGIGYVKYKLVEMVGSKGILFTSDGSIKVEVVGGVRLQPSESEELWINPEKVLDIVTRKNEYGFLAIGNPEIFENIKTDGHEILITFCGWGPHQETTYYRYVILLNVLEQP